MMKLTACSLTKRYQRKTAVDHIDLELTPGIIGLLGPNGAGKTTLIRMLCDLVQPDEGRVLLDGREIRQMGEDYRAILGYLPQKVGFYPWFTAEKYLMYLAALKGLNPTEAARKTSELLERVGLAEARRKRLGAYSGGMLQRIGIAQALLNDPKILILDEPTAGLDPQERIRFRAMLAGLARDRLVLLSTHIVSDVEHIATQVVVLHEGRILAQDTIPRICAPLAGRVCTLLADPETADARRGQAILSNMQPVGSQVQLRLICAGDLPAGAVPVTPNLEDAYLALCKGGASC